MRYTAKALTLVALFFAVMGYLQHSHAKCTAHDRWLGEDKALHIAGTALIAGWVGTATNDPMKGFLWGAGVGVAKEVLDSSGQGTCSAQDLAASLLGAGIGAAGAKWVLIPRSHGVSLVYFKEM
jgi:uncharacterized protein YfiM (DUF2279 family)